MKRMINDELLTADKKGIKVGKNLEVKGTTKLNGGLAFVRSYPVSSTQNINIMFETYLNGLGYTGFIGTLSDGMSDYLCMGTYLEVGAPYVVVSVGAAITTDWWAVSALSIKLPSNCFLAANFHIS